MSEGLGKLISDEINFVEILKTLIPEELVEKYALKWGKDLTEEFARKKDFIPICKLAKNISRKYPPWQNLVKHFNEKEYVPEPIAKLMDGYELSEELWLKLECFMPISYFIPSLTVTAGANIVDKNNVKVSSFDYHIFWSAGLTYNQVEDAGYTWIRVGDIQRTNGGDYYEVLIPLWKKKET